jgi:hypothetical protein
VDINILLETLEEQENKMDDGIWEKGLMNDDDNDIDMSVFLEKHIVNWQV